MHSSLPLNCFKGIKPGKEKIMKKFICIMPTSVLESHVYEAVGNEKIGYQNSTSFPIIPLIKGYTESEEDLQVIPVLTASDSTSLSNAVSLTHELEAIDRDALITSINADLSKSVDGSIELLTKLIPLFEDGDQVCVCLHFGTPAMQFAIISALQYAYRALRNVSIECVCTQGESGKYQNVDITALVQAGELLQTLTERRAKDPARILSMTLALGEDEE